MKILLTDGSYKNTLCAARALKNNNYKIACIGGSHCLSNASKYVNIKGFSHQIFGKYGSNITEEIIEPLLDHISKEKYDLIIPVGGNSVKVFSKIREYIHPQTKIILPKNDSINISLDKKKSSELCKELNINVPRTYDFKSVDELIKNEENISFPVITKSSHELLELPTKYFDNFSQLINSLKKFSFENNNEINFPIIQERINGPGIGYFSVFNKGKVVSEFMHQRVREIPPSGGSSTCAKSISDDELRHAGTKILKALNWHGPAMVEFKKNLSDEKIYFMEINPKLWGSLDLSYLCGINFTKDIVNIALENNQDKFASTNNYKIDQKFCWPLEGDLRHALQKPSNIVAVLVDWINPWVGKNIYVKDLKPSIVSLYLSIRNALSKPLKRVGLLRLYSLSKNIGFIYALTRIFNEKFGIPFKRHSKISDHIYIGPQFKKRGLKKILSWKVDTIISLRDESKPNHFDLDVNYKHLPSTEYQPISLDILIQGSQIIDECVKNNKKVYIHCREGVSRAPCIVSAYFISKGFSINKSISEIKKSRPFINILENQKESLEEFEIYLRDTNKI